MSNNGGVYTWSKTAANNASADNTVNYAEGQAPSSLNDSARSLMASVAKYRDDISGAIVTTGTSAAYIVASNQNFDTKADFHGQVIAFTPHITNTAGPITITVDGFANLPLRTAPNTDLLMPGVLIAGTPYMATYNNADGALYLQGFYGNPYNVPLASGMDYWGGTAPNSAFAFPIGQAISRTTYGTLFGIINTVYGSGDGSTTFNLPDKRGRVTAMLDGGTGRLITAFAGNFNGSTGGSDTQGLSLTHLPGGITSTGTISGTGSSSGTFLQGGVSDNFSSVAGSGQFDNLTKQTVTSTVTGTASVTSNNTGGVAHPNVQPTICCNYIMRIL